MIVLPGIGCRSECTIMPKRQKTIRRVEDPKIPKRIFIRTDGYTSLNKQEQTERKKRKHRF